MSKSAEQPAVKSLLAGSAVISASALPESFSTPVSDAVIASGQLNAMDQDPGAGDPGGKPGYGGGMRTLGYGGDA